MTTAGRPGARNARASGRAPGPAAEGRRRHPAQPVTSRAGHVPRQRPVGKAGAPARKQPGQKLPQQPKPPLKAAPRKAAQKKAAPRKGAGQSRTRPTTHPARPAAQRPSGPPRRPVLRRRPANPDRRLRFALLVCLFVLSIFAGRLVQLQGLDASALAARALEERSTTRPLYAHRGDIVDASGAQLATTVERRNITVDQTVVRGYNVPRRGEPTGPHGVAGAAQVLAPLLDMKPAEVQAKLTGTKRWAVVAKDVEPRVWRAIIDRKIPGIYGEQASRRTYPAADVGASLVGFVGKDGEPLAGVERALQDELAGKDGVLKYEKGADGLPIPTGLSSEVPPVDGRTVQLTIDRDLQWKTQETLAAAVRQTKARAGYAVVMDPRNGEVLALASVPTFDANQPGKASAADRENRGLIDVFEPGSTAKVVTAAAAMEEGKVTAGTRWVVDDKIRRGGRTFNDSHSHEPEKMTFAGVLAQSSNVGTILAGEQVEPKAMEGYFRKFGLGAKTGVGLPESAGLLAKAEDWNRSQRYTVLFGQGLSVTALQAAGVFSTLANDGVRVPPRLVKAIADENGKLVPQPRPEPVRAVSERTAKDLRLMLESVVGDDGTAVKATIPGYRVAGKTGTAQMYDDACGCYSGYTGSFIGMAPADDPQLVVAVFLQRPTAGYYGGTVAAPVFQQVMTYALAERGVAPSGSRAPKVPLTFR